MKRHRTAIMDHEFNAWEPAYIGDLMGVAYRSHRAMDYRQPGKFRGDEQGAFDMHMRVDEPGKDEGPCGRGVFGQWCDRLNDPFLNGYFRRVNFLLKNVYYPAFYVIHALDLYR